MSHMSQPGDTKGDGMPLSPHGTAYITSHPRSQHDVMGLRLQDGVPELPKSPTEVAGLGTWMHTGTGAAPSAAGQPKPTTHAVAGSPVSSHTQPGQPWSCLPAAGRDTSLCPPAQISPCPPPGSYQRGC